MSNAYCPFCGVILLPDPYWPNDEPGSLPPHRRRPWYSEVRGLHRTFDDISTTGLGIIRGRTIILAPADRSLSYIDHDFDALEEWGVCTTEWSGQWGFAVHDSCWQLLLLRLGHIQSESAIVTSVFYQLDCTSRFQGSSFDFGHDYEGAARTHKTMGLPMPVDLNSPFYADPCAIPSTGDFELAASSYFGSSRSLLRLEKPRSQVFPPLSAELKHEILSYLSYRDLAIIRRACRELAQLTLLDDLPQSYWRSRFLLGQEADFLFPTFTNTLNWCRLFFGTRYYLQTGNLSLTNRKRIRKLLEPIAALVERDFIFSTVLSGSPIFPAQGQTNRFQFFSGESRDKSQFVEIHHSFSGQLSPIDVEEPLGEDCRVLDHRMLFLGSHDRGYPRRIAVSTLRFGARSFISAIGISQNCSEDVDHTIGFLNAASKSKSVEVPAPSQVKTIHVAFCSQGLTGIQFMYTNSDSSIWFGDNHGPDIARATLGIPEGTNFCLVAGFDRFKIVSFGVGELINHPNTAVGRPSQEIDFFDVSSHLWTPSIPTYQGVEITTLQPPAVSSGHPFQPLVNVDFGGPGGRLLSSLTRLVCHLTKYTHPLVGLEIIYADGHSMLFGSKGACELSFPIDGPKGERINRIGILDDSHEDYLFNDLPGNNAQEDRCTHRHVSGLQISTNYNRKVTFATIPFRLNAAIHSIPEPPSGNTITGFIGLRTLYHDVFIRLGIQHQPCSDEPTDLADKDRDTQVSCPIPKDELQYDNEFSESIGGPGNYQTYATLKGVRRIQASTGIEGRSRGPKCISGFKLDYDGAPSAIVGQWMDGHDVFELSADENIQSITIWLTTIQCARLGPHWRQGQVATVRFETTSARTVTFQSPEADSISLDDMQIQYQTGPDQDLTAISWILNSSYDRVRAIISEDPGRTVSLIPGQFVPFDQAQKLYFQREEEGGHQDRIVTAEGYFHRNMLLGLVFCYASGTVVRAGDIDIVADVHQTIEFPPDSQVVGMFVGGWGHHIRSLKFYIELNRPSNQCQTLEFGMDPAREQDVSFQNRCILLKDEAAAADYTRISTTEFVYGPPKEVRLVGLYVSCQDFSRLGGVYEPGDDGVKLDSSLTSS